MIYSLPLCRLSARPKMGWIGRSFYWVYVSFHRGNPIHTAVFYTGFLNGPNDGPGGYNNAWSPSWNRTYSIDKFYYFLPIRLLIGGTEEIFCSVPFRPLNPWEGK